MTDFTDHLDFTGRLKDIRTRMDAAARDAGRPAQSVQLVAVSKTQPPEKLQDALDAGLRLFGENRVQEAQDHWHVRRAAYPDLRLHLIGGLQTNKVREAVALFDTIETVDRERLADALAGEMARTGRRRPCFLQVNTGEGPQKGGVLPAGLENLFRHCRDAAGLDVTGLMCIPPADADPAPHFALLATWAKRLGLPQLSMGMSHDFETAIRLGATHVRVGTALFGARQYVAG